ncbi:3',5'-cyclic-nucleotide phosphodiesterase PDE1 [Aspergillus undulatus]|uniref:3',5'-cyclic-nucleotide phosphodiesterase PDE1 n=1 Tax=Aspergillus undulatus TaxID=1810928 RepID=UPI003CCDAFEC
MPRTKKDLKQAGAGSGKGDEAGKGDDAQQPPSETGQHEDEDVDKRSPSRIGARPDKPEDIKGKYRPAMHVVVLGPAGGPREDRVTSLLVRSLATNWVPNSMVAVDAGTLLSGIIDALAVCKSENSVVTDGAFTGLPLPHQTVEANSVHIFKDIIGSVLITHPHLDHVSGLAINAPLLANGTVSKPVAALDSVIEALQKHIFNNVIWPNFSDEKGGIGCLTYKHLADGPSSMGSGDEKGYQHACEGLLTQCFGLSHGKYPKPQGSNESVESGGETGTRRSSHPRASEQEYTTVESSAFFLYDQHTGAEIIVFGDTEPDTVSGQPRNLRVWQAAAPRVASGQLRAIFIECSHANETQDVNLHGHLCPRHLADELCALAGLVAKERRQQLSSTTKRKRERSSGSSAVEPDPKTRAKGKSPSARGESPRSSSKTRTNEGAASTAPAFIGSPKGPLAGLSVYIIHVKEKFDDGPHPRETILKELNELEKELELGCSFYAPVRGEEIYI